jgi:hypothetical protein
MSVRKFIIFLIYRKDSWLLTVLVHNGLAFFLSWLTLATCLNFGSVLTYSANVNVTTSSAISIGLTFIIISVYLIIENIIAPRYFLNIFSPWFVFILATIGILIRNWKKNILIIGVPSPTVNDLEKVSALNIASAVILSVFILYFIAKLIYNYQLRKHFKATSDCEIREFQDIKL